MLECANANEDEGEEQQYLQTAHSLFPSFLPSPPIALCIPIIYIDIVSPSLFPSIAIPSLAPLFNPPPSSMDPHRHFVSSTRRIIVKVGTGVVTRADDGKFALGRIGSICEQIKELLESGIEVILVTSGAVCMGWRLLRQRRTLNRSFADHLEKPELQLDGKACAAVGQSGLITLYDTLFSLLDVASSQLLVTSNDFRNKEFRGQLVNTVNSLLAMQVVPIFNENDAVSTRGDPHEDADNVLFWDNDSLAALLALEVNADLLILLMDVEGLYTKPPSEPGSELIHTYVEEKHANTVSYGDQKTKSRGMDAKVYAAQSVANAGVPVIIASGSAPEVLKKIMQGDQIGTLFHKEANQRHSMNKQQTLVCSRSVDQNCTKLSNGKFMQERCSEMAQRRGHTNVC